jgi:hypothetical protein
VCEIGEVLDVVVDFVSTLGRLVGDPGVDSLQDTEATGRELTGITKWKQVTENLLKRFEAFSKRRTESQTRC